MRKVLFVAYDFPPCTNIGGSLRSEKFVKYLPTFGWHPTVLSLHDKKQEKIAELYGNVCRVHSITPLKKPYEITPYGWILPCFIRGLSLLREQQFDIIYVSCPPFPHTTALVKLGQVTEVPVIVDFRDAWSLDPYVEGSRLKKNMYRYFFPTVEKLVLAQVNWLIVNTPSAYEAYLKKYPNLSSRISCIPNGYDEADFSQYHSHVSKKTMTLLYAGRFGIGQRDPSVLLKAMKILVDEQIPINLKIVGDTSPGLNNLVSSMGLENYVSVCDPVAHDKIIEILAESDVLLLYQEHSSLQVSPVAGKTYEYLRTGKPILAIVPPGDNLSIIQRYAARYEEVTKHDTAAIARAVKILFEDWRRDTAVASRVPNHEYVQKYNRKELTFQLSEIFERIISLQRAV